MREAAQACNAWPSILVSRRSRICASLPPDVQARDLSIFESSVQLCAAAALASLAVDEGYAEQRANVEYA